MNVELEQMILEAQEEARYNSEECFDFSSESAFRIMYGEGDDFPDELREAWIKAYEQEFNMMELQKELAFERSCGC